MVGTADLEVVVTEPIVELIVVELIVVELVVTKPIVELIELWESARIGGLSGGPEEASVVSPTLLPLSSIRPGLAILLKNPRSCLSPEPPKGRLRAAA